MTRYGHQMSSIDQVGREGVSGGLNYVAHAEPVDLDRGEPMGVAHYAARSECRPRRPGRRVGDRVRLRLSNRVGIARVPCDTPTIGAGAPGAPNRADRSNLMVLEPDASGEICFDTRPIGARACHRLSRWGYLSPTATPTAEGLPYSGFVLREMPGFTALSPSRLFDTRDSGTPLASGGEYRYKFGGLPDSATAVALNITAAATTAAGWVSAYPCGGDPPLVSNLNYSGPNETVPNFAIVSLSADHEVCFTTLAQTHLIVDFSGYYAFDSGDGFVTAEPVRLFDTRGTTRIPAGQVHEMNIHQIASPPSGASAIVMNVTVMQPSGAGHITVYPCVDGLPTVSNLNYRPGETRPNLVTVRLPPDGRVCFYSHAETHLLADLSGFYAPGSSVGLLDFEPYRVFDTREPAWVATIRRWRRVRVHRW